MRALALAFLLLATPAMAQTPRPVVSSGEATPAAGVAIETLACGLEHPWSLAFLPDGEDGWMLVTERPGRLRYVRADFTLSEPIAGVPAVFTGGQGGLFDVVLHPRFAETRLVYLSHAAGTSAANRLSVTRGRVVGGRLEGVETIFAVNQEKTGGGHFSGRLAWLPDGSLLLSVGDGGNPPARIEGLLAREQAQLGDSHIGKILRMTEDGRPTADAPRIPGMDPYVWSLGHRNVQGMAWDAQRSRLFASEHGSLGGDELNLVRGI